LAKQTSRSGRGGGRKPVTIDLPSEEVKRASPDLPEAGAPPFSEFSQPEAPAGETAAGVTPPVPEIAADQPSADTLVPPLSRGTGEEPTVSAVPPRTSGAPQEAAFDSHAEAAFAAPPPPFDAEERASAAAAAPFEAPDEEPVIPAAIAPAAAAGTERRAARPSFASLLGAALIGGAIALAGGYLLARAGYLSPDVESPDFTTEIAGLRAEVAQLEASAAAQTGDDLAPLRDQIGALEGAVGELRSAAPAGAAGTEALAEIQSRLAELERQASEPRPNVSGDVEALRTEITALATELQSLAGTVPLDLSNVDASLAELRQEIARLSDGLAKAVPADRVAALEAAVEALRGEATGLQSTLGDLRGSVERAAALGPAVAADALAAALESGRSFVSELTALSTLRLDPEAIAGLEPHAETGLPTLAELSAGFEAAAETIALGTPVPEGAGALDRLLTSARGLVEVRPVAAAKGADPAAIISRVRTALAAGDLETALAEWNALPEHARTATAEWAREAEARRHADELVARLRSDALSRLGTEG
jgi:hypothetical protein